MTMFGYLDSKHKAWLPSNEYGKREKKHNEMSAETVDVIIFQTSIHLLQNNYRLSAFAYNERGVTPFAKDASQA